MLVYGLRVNDPLHDDVPTPSLKPARTLGARQVRALAHPLRMRMLDSLRDGPATASMLARDLASLGGPEQVIHGVFAH